MLNLRVPLSSAWSNILTYAVDTQEPTEKVRIITLKSYFVDCVYDLALQKFSVEAPEIVRAHAAVLITTSPPKVREFVNISHTGITVAVDRDVIDEQAINYAMTLVGQSMDILTYYGIVKFGDDKSFTLEQIPWFHSH